MMADLMREMLERLEVVPHVGMALEHVEEGEDPDGLDLVRQCRPTRTDRWKKGHSIMTSQLQSHG